MGNGKDCKHEEIGTRADHYATWLVCEKCLTYIDWGEVVILTKAQHQLMQDVVKAGEKVSEAWKTWKADKGFGGYSELSDALDDFVINVDALDKGE